MLRAFLEMAMGRSIEQLSGMADHLRGVLDAYDPAQAGTAFAAGRSIAMYMQAVDEIAAALGKSEAEVAAHRAALNYAVESMTKGQKASGQMLSDIARWGPELRQKVSKERRR